MFNIYDRALVTLGASDVLFVEYMDGVGSYGVVASKATFGQGPVFKAFFATPDKATAHDFLASMSGPKENHRANLLVAFYLEEDPKQRGIYRVTRR